MARIIHIVSRCCIVLVFVCYYYPSYVFCLVHLQEARNMAP